MKKILLVNPHDTAQSGFRNPPLGLLYLAGTLRVHGFEVHLVDGCLKGKAAIDEALERLQPDAVGISCLTPGRHRALEIAAQAKRQNQKTLAVLGGAHPTIMYRQILNHYPFVDAIVLRDGRIVFRATILPDRIDAEMLQGWSHPWRFVVVERHLESTKPAVQLSMFDILEGRYEVVDTNQHLNAENIWRLYNRGAVVEQVIDEIKNDYAATGIRTNDFWANDALFQTGLIAYNLLNCMRRLALPKGLRTAQIKRIWLLLLHMPANVVCRSRQLLIKIKRDHPLRLIFYQAMKALA
jgi:hypothetical protein